MSRGIHTGNKTFITIYKGQFQQRLKEPTDTSTARANKDGVMINYEMFDDFTGVIKDVQFKLDGDYGAEVHLIVSDDKETLCIQMKLDYGITMDFMNRFGNLDLNKEVLLNPCYFEDTKKAYFAMKQGETKIVAVHTKDEPKGLPEWEWTEDIGGKSTPVKTKAIKFLMDRVKEHLTTLVAPLAEEKPAIPNGNDMEGISDDTNSASDDLPF